MKKLIFIAIIAISLLLAAKTYGREIIKLVYVDNPTWEVSTKHKVQVFKIEDKDADCYVAVTDNLYLGPDISCVSK